MKRSLYLLTAFLVLISSPIFGVERISFPLPNAHLMSECYGKLNVLQTINDATGKGTREVSHPLVFQDENKVEMLFWEGKFYKLTEAKSDISTVGKSIPWMVSKIEKLKSVKFSTSDVGAEDEIARAIRACEEAANEARFSDNPKTVAAADKLVNNILSEIKKNNPLREGKGSSAKKH